MKHTSTTADYDWTQFKKIDECELTPAERCEVLADAVELMGPKSLRMGTYSSRPNLTFAELIEGTTHPCGTNACALGCAATVFSGFSSTPHECDASYPVLKYQGERVGYWEVGTIFDMSGGDLEDCFGPDNDNSRHEVAAKLRAHAAKLRQRARPSA